MKSKYRVLALLTVTLLVIGLRTPAQAQENSPSPEVPSATQEALPNPNLTLEQELTTLENTYRGQLAEYRTAERAYQIASQQYLQLNTLVSLEAAVQGMKQAMVLRDQVLITYLTILQTQLSSTPGINLDQKNNLAQSLITQLTVLQNHFQTAQAAETKDQVVAVATNFVTVGKETETLAYQVQTIVATGKLQTIYDKSVILADDIDQNLVATTADIKQGERQRAIAEVRSALTRAKGGIDYLLENQRRNASRNSFQTALQDLNQVYGDLSQVLDYLDELMRL